MNPVKFLQIVLSSGEFESWSEINMPHDFSNVDKVIESGLSDVAPAVVLTVYRHGKSLINRAYGHLDSPEQPTTTDTLFDLASVTKLYTTTAFLMQVAEGKVSLGTAVADVLPEFAAGGARPIGPMQDP